MISFESRGSFKNTEEFLKRAANPRIFDKLEQYGAEGVRLLAAATPKDEGETAAAWDYKIIKKRGSYTIRWTNSHMVGDVPVAILIQYGHATGTGGYVSGRDFINPVMKPLLDKISREGWKAVTSK